MDDKFEFDLEQKTEKYLDEQYKKAIIEKGKAINTKLKTDQSIMRPKGCRILIFY